MKADSGELGIKYRKWLAIMATHSLYGVSYKLK